MGICWVKLGFKTSNKGRCSNSVRGGVLDPITWVALAAAIVKFLVTELPGFIRAWKVYAKDSKYESQVEKYNAAVKKYKKTKSLQDLNELAK